MEYYKDDKMYESPIDEDLTISYKDLGAITYHALYMHDKDGVTQPLLYNKDIKKYLNITYAIKIENNNIKDTQYIYYEG